MCPVDDNDCEFIVLVILTYIIFPILYGGDL